MHKINLASGQRPFDSPWVNVDLVSQGYAVDVIADMTSLPEEINNCDIMVCHHGLEHIDMSIVEQTMRHWYDRLVPGGRLLIAVPDIRAIIDAWYAGRIDDYIFNVNVYGAYQGRLSDLHRWSYTEESLSQKAGEWSQKRRIRTLQELSGYDGADLAMDFWILMMEFTK